MSRSVVPPRSPRIENRASRTRSAVGRTAADRPGGGARRRPLSSPATTLIYPGTARLSMDALRAFVAEAPPRGVHERTELGRLERAVALQERDYLAARFRQHRYVVRELGHAKARQAVLARAEDLSLAAQREVHLRELESVALGFDRRQAAACELGARVREQDALRGVLAAADPATQLMELREAITLGSLDEHDRRVGDVDAHLDHAGRHQHVGLSRREALHRLLFLPGGHLAVQ